MRFLSKTEELRLELLTRKSISLTLIEPTETALKKSIMDATGPIRHYLKENDFHDYELQKQGPEHKVIIEGFIYKQFKIFKTNVSLYRPKTKNGDPRIWLSGLNKHAKPNDIIALICYDNKIHALNITDLEIENLLESKVISACKKTVKFYELNYFG